MTVSDIMLTTCIAAHPDDTVARVVEMIDSNKIRAVPVIDADKIYQGMFSTHQLLKKLLPLSATMDYGLSSLDFIVNAGSGITDRLQSIKSKKIGELLDPVPPVHPDTPHWEAVLLLVRHGSPLPVVVKKSGLFAGLLTEQSLMAALRKEAGV